MTKKDSPKNNMKNEKNENLNNNNIDNDLAGLLQNPEFFNILKNIK